MSINVMVSNLYHLIYIIATVVSTNALSISGKLLSSTPMNVQVIQLPHRPHDIYFSNWTMILRAVLSVTRYFDARDKLLGGCIDQSNK